MAARNWLRTWKLNFSEFIGFKNFSIFRQNQSKFIRSWYLPNFLFEIWNSNRKIFIFFSKISKSPKIFIFIDNKRKFVPCTCLFDKRHIDLYRHILVLLWIDTQSNAFSTAKYLSLGGYHDWVGLAEGNIDHFLGSEAFD